MEQEERDEDEEKDEAEVESKRWRRKMVFTKQDPIKKGRKRRKTAQQQLTQRRQVQVKSPHNISRHLSKRWVDQLVSPIPRV